MSKIFSHSHIKLLSRVSRERCSRSGGTLLSPVRKQIPLHLLLDSGFLHFDGDVDDLIAPIRLEAGLVDLSDAGGCESLVRECLEELIRRLA